MAEGPDVPGGPLVPDNRYADPHLQQRFYEERRILTMLSEAGIDSRAVLALGLRHAPRAGDLRAIERARAKTHDGRGRAHRRGGPCTCLWCRTFERPSLVPEHSACQAACSCDLCDEVAANLVGTALGLYGRMPADILRRYQRAIRASRRATDALSDLPSFAVWVRDAGPATKAAKSLTLDEPRGRRRLVIANPSDPGAILWQFDGHEAGELAAKSLQMAEDLEAFAASLRQPKGRPVEKAENDWIVGFAMLVRDASAKRGVVTPRSWLDAAGSDLSDLFFGCRMAQGEYARTRQRLMQNTARPRRARQRR
jgi:hypothetical protein